MSSIAYLASTLVELSILQLNLTLEYLLGAVADIVRINLYFCICCTISFTSVGLQLSSQVWALWDRLYCSRVTCSITVSFSCLSLSMSFSMMFSIGISHCSTSIFIYRTMSLALFFICLSLIVFASRLISKHAKIATLLAAYPALGSTSAKADLAFLERTDISCAGHFFSDIS